MARLLSPVERFLRTLANHIAFVVFGLLLVIILQLGLILAGVCALAWVVLSLAPRVG